MQTGGSNPSWVLVVHGGAPRVLVRYSEEEQLGRHQAVTAALEVAGELLSAGRPSLDAVQAAVRVLEDAPGFNAGRGAALTHEGYAELDASIMDGSSRRVGAVAGLRRARNPIDLARAVMEQGEHVFLIGEGAERFALSFQMPLVDPEYFVTERQIEQLRAAIQNETLRTIPERSGTVGAVALDRHGRLAAATSTGGITNKRFGRVGDSPIIGAGTFAEAGVCAVSTTGWGEYFIRRVAAYDVCARMKYAGASLQEAATQVIQEVSRMGGYGGLIAVDASGQIAMPYSTPAMVHGYVVDGQLPVVIVNDSQQA